MRSNRIATRAALVILVACSVGSCSISADTALAEKQVPQFHALLDEGRTAEIYTQASDDLKKATKSEFRSPPWTGPKIVGALLPTDIKQLNTVKFSSIAGKDLEKFPQFYVDYERAAPDLLKVAKPLDDLRKTRPKSVVDIDAFLNRHGLQENSVVWLPLDARLANMTMLLDRASGRPLGALSFDPW